MARYYAAILFLVSAFVSNANAEQTKDGLLWGNNSDEVNEQNLGDSGLDDTRLRAPQDIEFTEVARGGGGKPGMKDISVNKDGSVGWGIDEGGKTYDFVCPDGCREGSFDWSSQSNGEMSNLRADSISCSGNSKHVWAVANGKDLYRGFTVDAWMYRGQPPKIPPNTLFSQISVSFSGKHVYAVDTSIDLNVWYKKVSGKNERAWKLVNGINGSSYIAVDKDGNVFAISNGTNMILKCNTQRVCLIFGYLAGNAMPKVISVDKSGKNFWVLDNNKDLWYSDGSENKNNRFQNVTYKKKGGASLTIATLSVSGNGKKLFAIDDQYGDTYMADIVTSTLAAAVDEDEDEGCDHPEDNSEATFATVKSG